jgi:hypothetical protein
MMLQGNKRADKGRCPKRILLLASCTVLTASTMLARADTTATWLAETNGDWADPTMWSTNPNYPNNGSPTNTNYQALINATGGTAYTATVDSNITVDGITISSPDAELDQTSGSLQAGIINVNSGACEMDGGTLANTNVNLINGSFTVDQAATLSSVAITGANMDVNGTLNVLNSLSIDSAHTIVLNSSYVGTIGSNLFCDQPNPTLDNVTIEGTPSSYSINGVGQNTIGGSQEAAPGDTFTFGAHASVHGRFTIGDFNFINDGVITADSGSVSYVTAQTLTNNGTLAASNASADLEVQVNTWTASGVISATNAGQITLEGTMPTPTFAAVSFNSVIQITGTVNNTGNTLSIPAAGSIQLSSAIIGGTVDESAGNLLDLTGSNVILDGVHFTNGNTGNPASPVPVFNYTTSTITIRDGLTMDQAMQLTVGNDNGFGSAGSPIIFDGMNQNINNFNLQGSGGTLTSTNTVAIGGPESSGQVTLTLGPQSFLHGTMNLLDGNNGSATAPITSCTLINNGTISADHPSQTIPVLSYTFTTSGSLIVSVDDFINNGTLQATNGGTLQINSQSFANHGTLSISGGTLSVLQGSNTGTFNVGDGTLAGSGTIDANLLLDSDPSTLAFTLSSESDYDTLDVNGHVTLGGNLQITLADGFQPLNTDVFTVLAVNSDDSMTGQFSNIANGGRLETSDGAGSFLVNFGFGPDSNEIVLSDFNPGNVPEPAAASAFGLISLRLLARRRKA